METAGVSAEPPNGVRERIRSGLAAELSPVSPLPAIHVLVWRTTVVFVLLPALGLIVLPPRALAANAFRVWVIIGVIAAAEILLSFTLCSQMVPGCQLRVAAPIRVLGSAAAWLAATLVFFPRVETELLDQEGLWCLTAGLVMAAWAGAALWILARMGAVLSWGGAGATIGALAGLVGLSVLTFNCVVFNFYHQAFWHGLVLLAATVGGWTVGALASLPSSRIAH